MASYGRETLEQQGEVAAFERRQREHVHYQPIGVRARRRQRIAAARQRVKPMRFVSLHHHSTFSFLDGFQLPESHVRRATEINMGSMAITEHGNIFSHVRTEAAAEAEGIKPIFGCEFYMGWSDPDRRSQRKNHLTVIAKDDIGYRNLLTLVSRSWAEGFYYEPTVDPRWLVEHRQGLIVLSGCLGSALATALIGGKHVAEEDASYERGRKVAQWHQRRLGDAYFLEVQAFPELEQTRRLNPMIERLGKELGIPLVATMDVHYTAPEEAEIQKILHNVRPGNQRSLEDQVRDWGYDVPLCPPPTDKAIYRRLRGTGLSKSAAVEAIVSTEEIAQDCNVTLPKVPRVQFPLPDGAESAVDLWRKWLKEGWRYRGCHLLRGAERDRYRAQLKKEMELIEAKEYVNYFLIVSDSIRFAKDEQIPVGPARGSAAASLACYLLRITEINPMEFDNLVFERFIDWGREDMPDIDIDFATYGRSIVRDYLLEKYGEGCVNNVGTFQMYKSKMALDDVARVYQVPKADVESIKDVLIDRSSGDLRASATIEDTVDQFDAAYDSLSRNPDLRYAMDLEGNAKGFGVHAAGLVLSTEPITNNTAVIEKEVPAGSGNVVQVVAMDKHDAERQGLEKLDYLALGTMDMIAMALNDLGMTVEDLYAIPMDDAETIQGFHDNDVVGVFQFDGRATRIVNKLVEPDNFEELVIVNALSRPGPLHNGAFQGYVKAKHSGPQKGDQIHPALDRITKPTQYQIIFQEQILRIVVDIGSFDWTNAAHIRKIISKKMGEQEFNRQWSKFLDGALKVHERDPSLPEMDEETAKRIWGSCITAGSYAFNAAHSTSYAKIAFWCMWLKRHHPTAFYAASLAKTRRESAGGGNAALDRHTQLMRDANRYGRKVTILAPSLGCGPTWERVDEGTIRAGWEQVHGVGAKMAQRITEAQPGSWEEMLAIPGIGAKTLDVIQSFSERRDPFELRALDESMESVTEALKAGELGKLPAPTHSSEDVLAASSGEKVVYLGQPLHRNLRDLFEANRSKGVELDPDSVNRPDLSQWLVLLATDGEETVSALISRFKYPRFKEMVWKMQLGGDELILFTGNKGKIKGWDKSSLVYIDDMWVVEA